MVRSAIAPACGAWRVPSPLVPFRAVVRRSPGAAALRCGPVAVPRSRLGRQTSHALRCSVIDTGGWPGLACPLAGDGLARCTACVVAKERACTCGPSSEGPFELARPPNAAPCLMVHFVLLRLGDGDAQGRLLTDPNVAVAFGCWRAGLDLGRVTRRGGVRSGGWSALLTRWPSARPALANVARFQPH